MISNDLPDDAVLLPRLSGALLVSRAQATFCAVPEEEVAALHGALRSGSIADVGGALLAELERHGFFGEPRPTEPEAPTVQLQLTNECNLACDYCCTNSGPPRPREISLRLLSAAIREIPSAIGSNARVALLGGEPLLVPWALDLAAQVLDLELELMIFTNGVPLADRELAKRVAALCERGAEVRVSLAGVTRELCDRLSGAPRFDAALRGLQVLSEAGGRATVDLMLAPRDVDITTRELPALRRRLPAATPIALGLLFLGGRERGEHVFGSMAELEEALDRVAFEAGEHVSAPERAPLAYRREACSCALGHHLHVRSDGALFSCFRMEEPVGDLSRQSFTEVARALRAAPRVAPALQACRECALATLCGGGCRADNVYYTGDGDEPPCDTWRVQVLCELLAEDRIGALEWSAEQLLAEARARGIEAPERLEKRFISRHLLES